MGLAVDPPPRLSPFSCRLMRRAQHFGQPVDRSEIAVATTNLARRTRPSRRYLTSWSS